MITRSGSRRDLRSRGDSTDMITPMRRQSRIQRMKKTLNDSESESDREKFKSPVFNIHIHVPPFTGNNPTLMLPRIQPVIHLHFDELANRIDNNCEDNSKTLKEFLKNTPAKFNNIKFHYSNNMCHTDTSDVNKDTYKLNTSSRKKTVNSNTDYKKNKVLENTQNITDEEGNSSSKGDEDNFTTGTRFSVGFRKFSHSNLRRCTSTPSTNKNGNSRDTVVGVDLCGLEKQYNLKKAVVLLTDCRKEAALEERKNKVNSTNVSYRLRNNKVQGNKMDLNSMAKKPVSQNRSVQNGSPEANDVSEDCDEDKDLKDISDEEPEMDMEQLDDDSGDENQLVIDYPSEGELRKESEGPQISVNANCYKGGAAYSEHLTPPDSTHKKASLNKNSLRNEDNSEPSKIVQDVIQTPSTPQLRVKAIESLRSNGTPQIPSCHNEIVHSTSEGLITPTRTQSEIEAMLSLSRKNGGIYYRVYGSDEETPKRKRSESLTNMVEGCNFSEILRTFTQKKEDTNKSVRNSCPAKINEEIVTAKQYLPLEGRICRQILQNSPSPNRERIDNEIEPKEISSACENITFNSSHYIDKCNTSENSKTASTTQSNHETVAESEFIMNDHVEPDLNEKCQEEDLNTEEEEMLYGGESEEEIKNKGWSSGNKSINETNEMRKYEIDINVPELELLKKEMLKKNNKNKKNSSSDLKDSNKNKKLHLTPPINCSTPSKKMKLTNEKSKDVSSAGSSKKKSTPSTHSELLYIPLNVSGPTKFAVAPINQLTPPSTHNCRSFKESMLYGDRINRFNNSKVLHMYKAKHKARNISASNTR